MTDQDAAMQRTLLSRYGFNIVMREMVRVALAFREQQPSQKRRWSLVIGGLRRALYFGTKTGIGRQTGQGVDRVHLSTV